MERLQVDFSKVEIVSIFLGNRCNLHCPYCHKDNNEAPKAVSNKLKNILQRLGHVKIFFFGGEPTLYMETIKEIVDIKPDANYYITTNGILFDKYADYFNQHNFFVIFSYDGEHSTRGFDPLNKPIVVNKLGVSSTLTRDNCSLKQWAKDINHKEDVIKRPIYAYPHYAHALTKDTLQYTPSIIQMLDLGYDEIKAIKQAIKDYEDYKLINIRWKSLIALYVNKIHHPIIAGETRCANSRNIKLDLEGNQYECLYKREEYKGTPPQCTTCKIFPYCGGGCSKEINHTRECQFNKLVVGWFVHFYKEHKEACDAIVRFSKPDDDYR